MPSFLSIRQRLVKLVRLCVLVCAVAPAWASDASVRWAFVLNFARYAEWPAQKWASPSAPFNICLLPGDREMTVELSALEKHAFAARQVKSVLVSKLSDVEQCAVVFIPSDYKGALKPLLELIERHRVLSVSDRSNFIDEGGMIELTPNAGRYVFDVNLLATRAAEIRLSSQMLKLARTVK